MAVQRQAFAFDEDASLEENLTAFGEHIVGLDAELGAEMRTLLETLSEGHHQNDEIWDRLFATTTAPPLGNGEAEIAEEGMPANDGTGATQQPQNPQLPTVAGWLLEGISIEGFRGINNEGRPLELKFAPSRVNSLSAVNGVGKTSVHDAVRYAITGNLPWLEDLPAAERDKDYYLNRFHPARESTIKLRLVAEPGGEKCEVTVVRDSRGTRTLSAGGAWNAETVLKSLNREFVFLDGPTFQKFISARPLDRGRTFSGLLGLSAYSEIRRYLEALANSRAFNNHFEMNAHAQAKAREERVIGDSGAAIAADYELLVGTPLGDEGLGAAKAKCQEALAQIGPLASLCTGKDFDVIDIDACIEAIKIAEGGVKRERLGACIRERGDLKKINHEAPTSKRAAQLVSRAIEREEALEKTTGDLMLELYKAGTKVVSQPEWNDPHLCPLCDGKAVHSLKDHLAARISEFEAVRQATDAVAVEWREAGWIDLLELEALLEPDTDKRLLAAHSARAVSGVISRVESDALVEWLKTLRTLVSERDNTLATEQVGLEKELPPSSVEVTKKVETARRLQGNWRKLEMSKEALVVEAARGDQITRLKAFLDEASKAFAVAEAEMSKVRLAAVGPVFKDFFSRMSFHGVEPAVSKRANTEELQIRLAQFYGLADVSPQALLSESFRNAFAISLYLAAASLYGGLPKFIILDDVTSSFDAGHQYFLVELIRTRFARPGNPAGPQVILLSHDTMLEKLFNKHSNSGAWSHQRLEGAPQVAVLPQAGAVNSVRDRTISMLQAGQVASAKEGVRQYLEYRLSDLISKLRIPVPVDIAFNDDKHLAGEFLRAIDAAVKLHKAANRLVLDQAQEAGLNANMVTIVGNFLSHWGTGQALTFTAQSLIGVMQAIDNYCECFTLEPTPGAHRVYYKSLSQRQ